MRLTIAEIGYYLGVVIAILIGSVSICQAQYRTQVMQTNIRTLRVEYIDNQTLQRPYLVLPTDGETLDGADDSNTLTISFDEMSHDFHHYSYRVAHLNKDWRPSALSSFEYIDGFTTADITDYESSTTTQQAYTHYSLTFPNEDMRLKVSGNYAIVIYEDGDADKVVATACFSVVEPVVSVSTQVRSNTDIEFDGRYQQLDIDVQTAALNLTDASYVSVVVRQNGRLDNEVLLTHPTYVEPNRLRYRNNRVLIFEGGNEFRHFDTYSTYYAGYHVDRIRYAQGEYHALLDMDAVRGTMARDVGMQGTGYLTEYDNNGQWRVNAENTETPDIDAEYMWVHFCLPVRQPVMGNVFVGGGLFYNRFGADNMMQYDAEEKCYYLYAYLKQGGYDYQYYVQTADGMTLLPLDGSYWQTQNEYTLYIYYRPFGGRYDRLVGLQVVK